MAPRGGHRLKAGEVHVMFGWFRRRPKIPDGMIELKNAPFDEDGRPVWTAEIDKATKGFGSEFRAPFMFETSPGMCLGGYVARGILKTAVRTYEGRATLYQQKTDKFRTNVDVTAPGVMQLGTDYEPWRPYNYRYSTSLPKEQITDLVNTIRQLCEWSHTEELRKRRAAPNDAQSTPNEWVGEEIGGDIAKGLRESIDRNIALLEAPWDDGLYSQALRAKGHISGKAVQDEYERLILQRPTLAEPDHETAQKYYPPYFGTAWLDGDETWLTFPSVHITFDGREHRVPGGAFCFSRDEYGRAELLKILVRRRKLMERDNEAALIKYADEMAQLISDEAAVAGKPIKEESATGGNEKLEVPEHKARIWVENEAIHLWFPAIENINVPDGSSHQIIAHRISTKADGDGIRAAEALLFLRRDMMQTGFEALLREFAREGTDYSAILRKYKEILGD